MIKVEAISVTDMYAAIRGMRNPMNSWGKMDSKEVYDVGRNRMDCIVGENDMDLMRRLYKGGPVHAKYLRQIHVSMDIVCHHTWWAEFDTYKVATVRNSCSKMHKIHVKPFELADFSHEGVNEVGGRTMSVYLLYLKQLERLRNKFNETQEKKYWRAIIDMLPMGFNIRATVSMNYQTVMNILDWRSNHKVDEWVEYCNILRELPYIKEIRGEK